jgi:hypothetical protein
MRFLKRLSYILNFHIPGSDKCEILLHNKYMRYKTIRYSTDGDIKSLYLKLIYKLRKLKFYSDYKLKKNYRKEFVFFMHSLEAINLGGPRKGRPRSRYD